MKYSIRNSITIILYAITIESYILSTPKSEMIELYKEELQQDPLNYTAHFNLATELFKLNNLDEAIIHFKQTIKLAPSLASAHYNYGLALDAKGKKSEAHEEFLETLRYNTKHTKARMRVVQYLQNKEKYESALTHCKILIKIEPTNREYQQKLAQIYFDKNEIDKALIEYRKALILEPAAAQILMEYANTLNLNNSSQCAYEMYKTISENGISSINVSYNLAYTLKKMGDYPLAIELCKQIISTSPHYAQAHFTLGTSYLSMGNYSEGWQEYEWRWKQGNTHERTFQEPQWDGSDLSGKTIFLHAEQGLGDTFQFIRYAQLVKNKGAYVIAAVQSALVTILSLCPYIDKVVNYNTLPDKFDFQAALMTMPLILNTDEKTIPNYTPYLFADEKLIALWQKKLCPDTNFKIGLCWQGNPNYSTHFLRLTVASKSMHPAIFSPLGNIPGVSFYSLQKFHAKDIDESLPEGFSIHTFDDNFDTNNGRFMDTAALIKNLDLIITVDTAIAHLAGGLGVPVWVLLPEPADWRWLLNRSDSPWYPTMRLFRQTVSGNWSTVIDEVSKELEPFIHAQKNNK